MNWKSIFIFLIMDQIRGDFVQYASGYSNYWYNIYCYDGNACSQTIIFPSQFSRPTQVSINPIIIENLYNGNVQEVGYELTVSPITTTTFDVNLYPKTSTVQYLTLKWVAIDDKRIEILQNFNVQNPNSTILPHNNVNANRGIIFLTSYHGVPKLNFTLGLGTINSSSVEIIITQQNMKSLGYIVILGRTEFFDIEAQIIQPLKYELTAGVYQPRTVLIEPNKVWLFFLQYFVFTVNRNIQLELLPNFETTQTSYKYCTWDVSDVSYINGAHQCATLSSKFLRFRHSSLYLKDQVNIIEFSIPEINVTFLPITTNQQIIGGKNLKTLPFVLNVRCNKNYKITSQFYQCYACSYKKVVRYSFNPEITLQMFVIYKSQNYGYYYSQSYLLIQSNYLSL